jgi:hypothetical protein
MIYIETNVHGQGVKVITAFKSRLDFMGYADEITATADVILNQNDSITTICEKLYDMGMGYGARHHCRISREEAIAHIQSGVEEHGCWNIRKTWMAEYQL